MAVVACWRSGASGHGSLSAALVAGSRRGPVELLGGVPVGVQDTPAGALAAADNYVALASQSVEQNPGVFAALVGRGVRAPGARRARSPKRSVRAGDTQNMSNYARGRPRDAR